MFKNLSYWKEESQTKLSNILSTYDENIKKGISDLTREVCGLKNQLSVATNEKMVLMETVTNLNDEIRHLNEKLLLAESSSELKENIDEMQEANPFIEDVPPNQTISEEIWQRKTNYMRDQEDTNESSDNLSYRIISYEDEEVNNEEIEQCCQSAGNKDNKRRNLKNVHSMSERSDVSPKKVDKSSDLCDSSYESKELQAIKASRPLIVKEKMLKCEVCPYKTRNNQHLQRHLVNVHLKGTKMTINCAMNATKSSRTSVHCTAT